MSTESLLLLFVGVTAVALLVQGLSVWWAARSLTRLTERLERRTEILERDVRTLLDQVQDLVESMQPLGRVSENVSANAELLSEMIRERSRDVDQFVQEMLELGRDQASKVDYIVTDTAQKFGQTTDLIQKDIIKPAVEISSFIKGIRAGLTYLFSNRQPPPSSDEHAEEEMFI